MSKPTIPYMSSLSGMEFNATLVDQVCNPQSTIRSAQVQANKLNECNADELNIPNNSSMVRQ